MRQSLPVVALGLALNGFWLYLGVLDVAGVHPHTSLTAAWYAFVGLLCVGGAWQLRDVLRARLAARVLLTRAFLVAGVLVAVWFLANVALISSGSLPHKFAGELVLWSLPAGLLALALPRELVPRVAAAVAVLGGLYLVVEIAALAHHPQVSRYSPIAELDPISAAQVPALAAVALLALVFRWGWRHVAPIVALAALVAGAVLPGSRGPILALVVGLVAAAAVRLRKAHLVALAAVVAGLAAGYAGTKAIGSATYLTSGTGTSSSVPYSTIHIREEWWRKAVHGIPEAPVFGNGVAMLVDDTPEARRMGVAGERTYPHNSPLESLYSLGILGALPYLVFLVSAIAALVLLVRRRLAPPAFAAGLYGFAFAAANVSGEIGADAALWAAGALAVGLYADGVSARDA